MDICFGNNDTIFIPLLTVHHVQGETKLAIATLQRLGEEVENCLKQLLFGTVRRSLRVQVSEEMRRYSYLGTYEWKILEKISLIEVHLYKQKLHVLVWLPLII